MRDFALFLKELARLLKRMDDARIQFWNDKDFDPDYLFEYFGPV